MALVEKIARSPIGEIRLVADGDALVGAHFVGRPGFATARVKGAHAVLDQAMAELTEYFAGARQQFSIPIHLCGTPFQIEVWEALRAIPCSSRTTYAELARRVGRPRAVRAVGAANGRNPLVIFVPCHRVVGRDGCLTGYGGGLDAKDWLLAHEKVIADGCLAFDSDRRFRC